MIAIDLSKQEVLDADPRAIQQINFTANLEGNTIMFFIIEEEKETVLTFHKELYKFCKCKVWFNFCQYKMTQCNSLNVKLSNSRLNKLNSAIKNETEVVFRLLSNMIGDNKTNFPHKLLLANRKVANLCKVFTNYSSTDIKLSKTQLSKMI